MRGVSSSSLPHQAFGDVTMPSIRLPVAFVSSSSQLLRLSVFAVGAAFHGILTHVAEVTLVREDGLIAWF